MQFSHGEKQKDYLFWKWQNLKAFSTRARASYEYSRSSGRKEWCFYTSYLKQLSPVHAHFYQLQENGRYRKVIPENLGDLLADPLSLLVCYLDNGSLRQKGNSCRIASQSFSEAEHEIVRASLRDNFSLESKAERWKRPRGGFHFGLAIGMVSFFASAVVFVC